MVNVYNIYYIYIYFSLQQSVQPPAPPATVAPEGPVAGPSHTPDPPAETPPALSQVQSATAKKVDSRTTLLEQVNTVIFMCIDVTKTQFGQILLSVHSKYHMHTCTQNTC